MGDGSRRENSRQQGKIYKPKFYNRGENSHYRDRKQNRDNVYERKSRNPNFNIIKIQKKPNKLSEDQKQAQLDRELDAYFNKDGILISRLQRVKIKLTTRAVQKNSN